MGHDSGDEGALLAPTTILGSSSSSSAAAASSSSGGGGDADCGPHRRGVAGARAAAAAAGARGESSPAAAEVMPPRPAARTCDEPPTPAACRKPLPPSVLFDAKAHHRLALLGVAALFGFLLPPGGISIDGGPQPSRITQEALPPGALEGAWPRRSQTPALRGCCGAPTEFLWVFLDEAQQAEAGKPFRTKVFARDALGRQARPADCETLRVDLGLSGRARLSSDKSWRRGELELVIENEAAEVVQAEVRIESPDPTMDILLHTSQIRFRSGNAHRWLMEMRPKQEGHLPAIHPQQAGSSLKAGQVTAWSVGRSLEVVVTLEDRFGNRVSLPEDRLIKMAVRSDAPHNALQLQPASGQLKVDATGEVGIVGVSGTKPGVVEIWLEATVVHNSSLLLARELRAHTSRTVMFASTDDAAEVDGNGVIVQPPPPPPAETLSEADARWAHRAQEVREAFQHAWSNYRTYAWGKDELMPLSRSGKDTFGGIGATAIDSLTTLWLMGLTPEFERAAAFVRDELDFTRADDDVSVFELVIRGVGGLLGAHALSGRQYFLDRARELADRLLPAFNTSSRLPWPKWNLAKGRAAPSSDQPTILSEAGSVQLEFRALSQQTGEPRFREVGDAAFEAIQSPGLTGLMPVYLTPPDRSPVRALNSKFAFGALTDSYYEYLLKQWIQSPTEDRFKTLWISVIDELPGLIRPRPTQSLARGAAPKYKLVEVAPGGETVWKMDHLSCYAPAMIALGLGELPKEDLAVNGRNASWWSVAQGVAESCVDMWTSTKSGLAPEFVMLRSTPPFSQREVTKAGRHSFLRPETAESLFYLYRATGDEKYRRWGEQLFQAILDHAKVPTGFCSVRDVNQVPTQKVDELQSFVLAETFKYLYLLFSPEERLDMGRYVLNTEGHPLLRPRRAS